MFSLRQKKTLKFKLVLLCFYNKLNFKQICPIKKLGD